MITILLDHTSTTSFHFHYSLPLFQFATNEAIQRTEAYEYAQSLGSQPCSLPNFQVGSFLHFCHIQNFIVFIQLSSSLDLNVLYIIILCKLTCSVMNIVSFYFNVLYDISTPAEMLEGLFVLPLRKSTVLFVCY